MPITLPPLSRRNFLAGSLAGLAALGARGRCLAEQPKRDVNRVALFADTHIAADRQTIVRDTNMTDNFVQAAREVLLNDPGPTAVMICGDCAYLDGKEDDYRVLRELVLPLREGGAAVHFLLGNHDHRQRFWDVLEEGPPRPSPVLDRHVSVRETPHANWFLLDSLDETNKTPGVLGKPQLDWLAAALDQRADKPALVMVHHNPDPRPEPSGLVETRQLLDLLTARPHVKTLFFGHSHHWVIGKVEQLHLVNLPPVAYLFQEGDPNAWVDVRLNPDGANLTLHCIQPSHPMHGKQFELKWS